MQKVMIEHRNDLVVELLRLLQEHPRGLETYRAYRRLRRRCRFPEEWEGDTNGGREPKWQNEIRWARLELKKRGLLRFSPRGVWRLKRSAWDMDPGTLDLGERHGGGMTKAAAGRLGVAILEKHGEETFRRVFGSLLGEETLEELLDV